MNDRIWQAALAGLLHDIGKLEQRARVDPWNPPSGMEAEGQPVHAAWSLYFCEHSVSPPYKGIAYAGAYHHVPERSPAGDASLSELVALADKLSAGERSELQADEHNLPKQLVSIFDRIILDGKGRQGGWHYLPLQPLRLDRQAIFPGPALTPEQAGKSYDLLCERMRHAASTPVDDPRVYVENVLEALRQVAWCVPSAYYHAIPDVSLYDHSRSTAALAVCLAELPREEILQLLEAVRRDFGNKATPADRARLRKPVAALIGGDISGIQDFLYTISSRGAAKTLRGRSFYLQLLTEAALAYLLERFGLPYTNVIYSGGGHFYLLAPLSALDLLPAIQVEITRKLRLHHGNSLYLALGSAQVPASGMRAGEFSAYWDAMHGELARAKQRRYSELGENLIHEVFAVPELGGNPEGACSVCGEDRRPVKTLVEEREEQARICDLCSSFDSEIGRLLPQATFVALGFGPAEEMEAGTASDALRSFGMTFQVLNREDRTASLPGARRAVIWALEDPPDERWPSAAGIPSTGMRRYAVNQTPPMTFTDLEEQCSTGFKRLGVLRMDIDSLGEIFKRGLGEGNEPGKLATLARLSMLSFQVSLFFEGWVKHLCESGPYRDRIYAVYSGGDDVFLIGPWDEMPDLAAQIVSDLSDFTGGHPAVHVSAGLSFMHGKYPIYQAAQDAHEALSEAKSRPGKQAIHFLGKVWSWSEFAGLAEKRDRIVQIAGNGGGGGEGGPRALIQVIRMLADDQADTRKTRGKLVWGRWMWRGNYLLCRMVERIKGTSPEAAEGVRAILQELSGANYSNLPEWGTAARWAQLLIRKKPQSENEAV